MTASPTPTDAGAGMPGELFAESAKNPTCQQSLQVGLPSEETIARSIYHSKPRNKPWDVLTHEFKNQYRKQARTILSLIRPAFEAKERIEADARIFKINATSKLRSLEARALSAEAKLAQAVEALEPFAEVAGTEEGVGRDDPEDDRILVVQAHGCQLAILSTEDFRRARSAARGETE